MPKSTAAVSGGSITGFHKDKWHISTQVLAYTGRRSLQEGIEIVKLRNLWKRDLENRRQNVPCVLAGIVLALSLGLTANAQSPARSATDPPVIKALSAAAYVWGLGPEYIERFSKYNTIVGAPLNALTYGSVPAAWNNDATNAGDASVLYISAFVNFDESPELVLTVPPSRNQYYVVAYYDAYANTIGSIGTRTTPSDAMTSYLLVGPKSRYAKKQTAKIDGYEYPVMASDTNVNWLGLQKNIA
jgi:hypothetical protein